MKALLLTFVLGRYNGQCIRGLNILKGRPDSFYFYLRDTERILNSMDQDELLKVLRGLDAEVSKDVCVLHE